ncbi:hypothetical protein [Azospirillum melinis]
MRRIKRRLRMPIAFLFIQYDRPISLRRVIHVSGRRTFIINDEARDLYAEIKKPGAWRPAQVLHPRRQGGEGPGM